MTDSSPAIRVKYRDTVELGEMRAEVKFATASSVRLQIAKTELVDTPMPRPKGSRLPKKTYKAHPRIGIVDLHYPTDGEYDVFATLELESKYCDGEFPLSLFKLLTDALQIPNDSYEIEAKHNPNDEYGWVSGNPNRPVFYGFSSGTSAPT